MTARLVLILALALSALGGCASLAPELSGNASSAVQSAALLEDIRVARAYASLAAVRSGAASLLERDHSQRNCGHGKQNPHQRDETANAF